MKNRKPVKKLLAGLMAAALLAALAPAALAAPVQENPDLLDVLEQLYAERSGVMLLDADSDEVPEYTNGVKYDEEHSAEVTLGPAAVEDGTAAVPVYVTAPAGLNGVQMTVTYGEGLTYTGAEENSDFAVNDVRTTEEENTVLLIFGHESNVTEAAEDYLLTTLTFAVDEDAEAGADISVTGSVRYVTYNEDDDVDYVHYSVVYKAVTTENATVTLPGGVLLGDVDNDGKIDAMDASYILQYYAKSVDGSELNLAAADVDGDGKIDAMDASYVLQYYAKLINKFPAEQ